MTDVLHLFPKLNSSLVDLLEKLEPQQWYNSTLCKKWTVKDIAAHLLDGALRRLSAGRDSYSQEPEDINLNSYNDLLDYLNDLNADWVKAYRRISPQLLIKQLTIAQNDLYQYLKSLDPNAEALFPVSWAGESRSVNHFDIAREYTERWLHQQQIRQATGTGSLLERELYHPFLEICMQALPYHFKDIKAIPGTSLILEIVGDAGGRWSITRTETVWIFFELEIEADTHVYIDQNIAWMLFSRGIDINEAAQFWQIVGDHTLGAHALKMHSFMVRKD